LFYCQFVAHLLSMPVSTEHFANISMLNEVISYAIL